MHFKLKSSEIFQMVIWVEIEVLQLHIALVFWDLKHAFFTKFVQKQPVKNFPSNLVWSSHDVSNCATWCSKFLTRLNLIFVKTLRIFILCFICILKNWLKFNKKREKKTYFSYQNWRKHVDFVHAIFHGCQFIWLILDYVRNGIIWCCCNWHLRKKTFFSFIRYFFVCLCYCLSIYLFICLFISLSVCLIVSFKILLFYLPDMAIGQVPYVFDRSAFFHHQIASWIGKDLHKKTSRWWQLKKH